MKKLILALLLSGVGSVFAQKKIDFSGNFKVNEEKVNWGPAPKSILPRFIKVDQKKEFVIISRTPLDQQLIELPPVVDTIGYDGKPFTKNMAGGRRVTSSLKWVSDSSFVLTRTSLSADGKVAGTVVETWSMEDSGRTLFVNREVSQGSMNFTTKAYFDRQ